MTPLPRKHRKNEDINASKGGKARAAKLSPQKRKAIARKAARAHWTRPVDEEVPPPKVL
jgi:hypothetical protein